MALKQIIIVDEDGSKCTIRTSEEPYQAEVVLNGRRCIEMGSDRPLTRVLASLIKTEWMKVREFGARLAQRNRSD
jgi:hypothetical protein